MNISILLNDIDILSIIIKYTDILNIINLTKLNKNIYLIFNNNIIWRLLYNNFFHQNIIYNEDFFYKNKFIDAYTKEIEIKFINFIEYPQYIHENKQFYKIYKNKSNFIGKCIKSDICLLFDYSVSDSHININYTNIFDINIQNISYNNTIKINDKIIDNNNIININQGDLITIGFEIFEIIIK